MNRIITLTIVLAIVAWVASLNMARADDGFGHFLHDVIPHEHHDDGDAEEHHEHDDHMYYDHGVGHPGGYHHHHHHHDEDDGDE